jgi:hypothetical protein
MSRDADERLLTSLSEHRFHWIVMASPTPVVKHTGDEHHNDTATRYTTAMGQTEPDGIKAKAPGRYRLRVHVGV